ncbi:MAG: fibronectin type III domain-containing protein [candidate division Zixibacteria bacterium]|nr:fibronectin type III domain-containing protein [candidate division Zixibacteria bacterium]
MDKLKLILLSTLTLLFLAFNAGGALAQDESPPDSMKVIKPVPPVGVSVVDRPNDNGHRVLIRWEPSPGEEDGSVIGYKVYRSDNPDDGYEEVGALASGAFTVMDGKDGNFYELENGDDKEFLGPNRNLEFLVKNQTYYYQIASVNPNGVLSDFTPPAGGAPEGNWYHTGKTSYLIAIIIYVILVLVFIKAAKSGKELYIRPLGGIEAIDNAIGRATEMGRPILFVLGTGTAADIATIAGYTILSRVARKTAEYQIPVLVPVNEPVMMSVAQETVRSAYMEAGRPDLYDEKNIPYVTAMQFPYVAAVNGIMLREKTATNFYMGLFHAEALLLAETGATTGAIQISGTDQPSQLPFFIAATDFTLIGEELYAASAYLSKRPQLLGPLKAQDYAKAILIVFIILGTLTLSFDWKYQDFIANLFKINL